MKFVIHICLVSLLWQDPAAESQDGPALSSGTVTRQEAGFLIAGVAGRPALLMPREERLVYRVSIDFGLVSASVGTVVLETAVNPFKTSILLAKPEAGNGALECAVVTLHAKGDYSWYSLDSTIESLILPQEWPRIIYRTVNEGTERRRREIMIGLREGTTSASYRKDTSKGAPKGTRIWCEPGYRKVPEGTVDMLTAMFFPRTLVQGDAAEVSFPLIDKDRIWLMKIRRGEDRRIKTKAGTFDVVEADLDAGVYPGEEVKPETLERFEGLFGSDGSVRLWVERHTGVPVKIEGSLPLGPITLGVDMVLESYAGTPEGFVPVQSD